MLLERNVRLAYLICLFRYSWFWLGIWVFYYLRFTDYAGIGLIETSLIVAMTISEIPTGAIADLLGKKRALLIGLLLQALGIGILGIVPSLLNIMIGVFIAGVGGSFYSGTFEALIYDSLKQVNNESSYDKVIAHVGTISLISPAISSVIGGFMYILWPPLPFIASSMGYLGGVCAALFLTEPFVDSEKFTFRNTILQIRHGIDQLFKSAAMSRQTLFFLSIGFVIVIADEMLNSFLGVEFGFDEKEIGMLWSVIYLLSSFASQFTPILTRKIHQINSVIFSGILIALTFLVSPFISKAMGGFSLLLRSSLQVIFLNLVSVGINQHSESKYRATTLSVFNMLKNIPYVLTAYFIGGLSDYYSAKIIASWLGVFLAIIIIIQFLLPINYKVHKT